MTENNVETKPKNNWIKPLVIVGAAIALAIIVYFSWYKPLQIAKENERIRLEKLAYDEKNAENLKKDEENDEVQKEKEIIYKTRYKTIYKEREAVDTRIRNGNLEANIEYLSTELADTSWRKNYSDSSSTVK